MPCPVHCSSYTRRMLLVQYHVPAVEPPFLISQPRQNIKTKIQDGWPRPTDTRALTLHPLPTHQNVYCRCPRKHAQMMLRGVVGLQRATLAVHSPAYFTINCIPLPRVWRRLDLPFQEGSQSRTSPSKSPYPSVNRAAASNPSAPA